MDPMDYATSRAQYKQYQRVATDLANLLWTLSHEMSLEEYGTVESAVFSRMFGLVHQTKDRQARMAGCAALTALWDAPSADEERKGDEGFSHGECS